MLAEVFVHGIWFDSEERAGLCRPNSNSTAWQFKHPHLIGEIGVVMRELEGHTQALWERNVRVDAVHSQTKSLELSSKRGRIACGRVIDFHWFIFPVK
jgi:hypothetical protein